MTEHEDASIGDPDLRLSREIAQALERWEKKTGGTTAKDRVGAIRGIVWQNQALGRHLDAAA